jgi:hypothetical protein
MAIPVAGTGVHVGEPPKGGESTPFDLARTIAATYQDHLAVPSSTTRCGLGRLGAKPSTACELAPVTGRPGYQRPIVSVCVLGDAPGMYRDIAIAYLWLVVLWTLGSWAEFYLGIPTFVGFTLGLIVANAIVARAFLRRRRQTAAVGDASVPSRVEVGPTVHA